MINPFLYNFTNQDFRKAFRDLLHIKKSKTKKRYDMESSSIRKPTIDMETKFF